MQRIHHETAWPLFHGAATRAIEQRYLAELPQHTLMRRAGHATARLALALAPHATTIWIACGRGNNGGDGLEAAAQLARQGKRVVVTWLGHIDSVSSDTLASWQRAQESGVLWADAPPSLQPDDLGIDALLGIGLQPTPQRAASDDPARMQRLHDWIHALNHSPALTLALDVPSGLDADHGTPVLTGSDGSPVPQVWADHTLSLLTLKPGLFTHCGRDAAGQVWLDTLDCPPDPTPPTAWLAPVPTLRRRHHASHKGSYGDVQILGGEGLNRRGLGMGGAALLAGRAALHAGAGRVLVALLDDSASAGSYDPVQPELMLRQAAALDLSQGVMVCGCGGGDAVRDWIEPVLSQCPHLVLDADALNAIASHAAWADALAQRPRQGQSTVLTPHPLEAARMLGCTVAQVQSNRLGAAQQLADRTGAVVVLKGSGTVVAQAGRLPSINPTGNARLACAGTGDVLAGLIGALWAAGLSPWDAAVEGVWRHGHAADQWPADRTLTASQLASRIGL